MAEFSPRASVKGKAGSGRAEPEVLSCSPDSGPTPLIPNHNNPAALLGRSKVGFAAPGLGERIKRLRFTFTFTLPQNQKHPKLPYFAFGHHMPPTLLTVFMAENELYCFPVMIFASMAILL